MALTPAPNQEITHLGQRLNMIEHDIIAECLQAWIRRCHGMHTPTWSEWEQETREALREYSKQTEKDTVPSNEPGRRVHIAGELLAQGKEAGME